MQNKLPTKTISSEKTEFLKKHYAPGATDLEFDHFIGVCNSRGLSPEAGHIYFAKFKDRKSGEAKVSHLVSIDAYRLMAQRTGCYAGSSEPIFEYDETSVTPSSCKVTVKKLVGNTVGEFVGKAFTEDQRNLSARESMWRKSPRVMLEKCAEAKALRKAFPEELGGLSLSEDHSSPIQATPEVIKISEPCFDMNDQDRRRGLNKSLAEQGVKPDHWDHIAAKLHGTPNSLLKETLDRLLAESVEAQDVISE